MPAPWTLQQITDNLVRTHLQWATATISFGFPTIAPGGAASGETAGFSAFTDAQKAAARLAVGLWDDVAAVDFVETASSPQVKFENTTTNNGYAHAYFPGSNPASGSIWMNPDYDSTSGTNDLVTPVQGQWGFMTYMHELGHALGLSHPGNYPTGATYGANAAYQQDTIQYSVMSYFTADNTGADWTASDGRWYFAQTPMLHDIAAIQQIYGVETATRASDTVYGFHATADQAVFDFTFNLHPVLTIWDGAGVDTLDLSGFTLASRISLVAGTFSDCDAMTQNISIAFGCLIENAAGGAGNDSITGNVANNVLQGNAGNDTLIGGAGADRLDGGVGADIADYRGGATITLNLLTGVNTGDAAGDTLVSIELIYGSNTGADSFTGNNSANFFYGFGGNDTFRGVFGSVAEAGNNAARDRITDFTANSDHIDLSLIDAIAGGADDAFTFLVGAFDNHAGEVHSIQSGAITLIEGDINGDAIADFQIELTGLKTLTAADFIL
jgi:serralysin